ncbi:putative nucleotide-diphospho-sugar transferase, glucose N-acetyltransferase 1 [Septoria linicola]|nr:putative nucleotide-diphospho-sugar transferase, glucose N-acetyltransferase 1 [Septoria linicola]
MRPHFAILAALSLAIAGYFLYTSVSRIREQHRLNESAIATLTQEKYELASALQQSQHDAEDKVQEATMRAEQERKSFAYSFYATNDIYACGVLVNIQRLHELKAQYQVHVLVSPGVSQTYVTKLVGLGATIHVEDPPPLPGGSVGYYNDCLLKLLSFKLHQLNPGLKRVLAFDSDQLIMQNLDHLFTGVPAGSLAAPRAYWLAKDFLASTFMMIDLSDRLWTRVNQAFSNASINDFDMDIINKLLGNEVTMLPGLYCTLNSHWEDWNIPSWLDNESTHSLNWTTIERVNQLARDGATFNQKVSQQLGSLASPDPSATASSSSPRLAQTYGDTADQIALAPRFPEQHPLSRILYDLQTAAAVIHFSAIGKPWTVTPEVLRIQKPDAHPLLGVQFEIWRTIAMDICPDFEEVEAFS